MKAFGLTLLLLALSTCLAGCPSSGPRSIFHGVDMDRLASARAARVRESAGVEPYEAYAYGGGRAPSDGVAYASQRSSSYIGAGGAGAAYGGGYGGVSVSGGGGSFFIGTGTYYPRGYSYIARDTYGPGNTWGTYDSSYGRYFPGYVYPYPTVGIWNGRVWGVRPAPSPHPHPGSRPGSHPHGGRP